MYRKKDWLVFSHFRYDPRISQWDLAFRCIFEWKVHLNCYFTWCFCTGACAWLWSIVLRSSSCFLRRKIENYSISSFDLIFDATPVTIVNRVVSRILFFKVCYRKENLNIPEYLDDLDLLFPTEYRSVRDVWWMISFPNVLDYSGIGSFCLGSFRRQKVAKRSNPR